MLSTALLQLSASKLSFLGVSVYDNGGQLLGYTNHFAVIVMLVCCSSLVPRPAFSHLQYDKAG